jgi:YidC/Oxa1 family membrane protein insertase
MDRKGIIAVALAIGVLLFWQIKIAPKLSPPPPAASQATPGASPAPSAVAPGTASQSAPASTVATAFPSATPGESKAPEKVTNAAGPAAKYVFTNLGGGISRAELTGYPAESGSNVALNEFGTLPIGALSEKPAEGADLPYIVTQEGNTVLCVRDQPGGLAISKKFTLPGSTRESNGYRVAMDVSFANKSSTAIKSPGYYLYVGSATPVHQRDLPTYTAFDWCIEGGKSTHVDVTWFKASKIPFIGIETRPERQVYTMDADKIGWAAITNQYFTTIVTPQNGAAGNSVWAHNFPVKTDDRDIVGIEGSLHLPAFSLAPGQTITQSFAIYAGPKIYGALQAMGDGQEHVLNFGMFGVVSVFLLNSMNWLHSWTGSYAIAIIILTLCIRGVLWPIQNKATASMRQMQELQPRMTELKEKYKDDPTRMNTEVMKLYKEYHINPLAGCLPMFVQLPIFWGFYRMLGTAIELRNSRFLWVHDLSQPDTVFHVAGFPVNILPICMALSMIVQMSMTPKTGDKSQQRMFMFMPLIFVMFCYNFASALALYWTVQNVFSIAQLYVTRKRTAPAPLKPQNPARRKSR